MGLALLRRIAADVLEHHLDARHGTDIGDARAHHPGAQHPDLAGRLGRHALGPRAAGVDFIELEPEGADHVLRHLAGGQLGEVASLDQLRGLEVHLGALHRGTEDLLRRREAALGLGTQDRRSDGQHLRHFRVRRGAAGNLVALHIPGLPGRRVAGDPGPGLGQQLVAVASQLIHQARLQRLPRPDLLALEQVRQGLLQAQHAHHAHDPAATGQQAQGDFRQADLQRLVVQGHAVMASQADFPTAAQGRAVDCRHHRLAQGLQRPQLGLEGQNHVIEGLGLGFSDLDQLVEIAAGEEGFLRRRDDHPGDVGLLGLQPGQGGGHGVAVGRIHGVGALARHVDGQDHDLVLAFFVTDGIGHERIP